MGQASTHRPQRMQEGHFGPLGLVAAKGQDGVGPLEDGGGEIELGHAHHGAAHQDLVGVLPEAAGRLDHLPDGGAHPHFQVFGRGDGASPTR